MAHRLRHDRNEPFHKQWERRYVAQPTSNAIDRGGQLGCFARLLRQGPDRTGRRSRAKPVAAARNAGARGKEHSLANADQDSNRATAEIVLERENRRIVGLTRRDRSGEWQEVLRGASQASTVDLVQSRDTAVFGPVGTFVGDGVLGAYGTNEFYDSTGAFWRVKSLWSADSPPMEEVHYRNGILVAVHSNSWTRENDGWLLTATRTQAYDYDTGEFLVEMLDSLQHWQPSSAQPLEWLPSEQFVFASLTADGNCLPSALLYFAQSSCPTCGRTSYETAYALVGFIGATYSAYSFVRNPARVWNVKEAVTISVAWVGSLEGFMYSAATTNKCWTDRRRCVNSGGTRGDGSDGGGKKLT